MKPVIKKSDRKGFKYVCSFGNQECHAETQIEAYNNLILAVGISVVNGLFSGGLKEESSIIDSVAFSHLYFKVVGMATVIAVHNNRSLLNKSIKFLKIAGSTAKYSIERIEILFNCTLVHLDDGVDINIPKGATVWFYE